MTKTLLLALVAILATFCTQGCRVYVVESQGACRASWGHCGHRHCYHREHGAMVCRLGEP